MKIPSQIHKILVAIEDSAYSEIAADYGFALARQLGAEIGLLHANEVPINTPSYTVDPMFGEPPLVMPEMIKIQEEASKSLLDRITNVYGQDCTVSKFLKMGNPIDEILLTANEWDADLIILGTHGRTGLDHFIAGSVAEKVVRKSKCPVLIIPNPGKEKKSE